MMCLSFDKVEKYNKLQSYLKEHGEFKFTEETSDNGELYYPEYIIKGELPPSIHVNAICSDLSIDTKSRTDCYTKTKNYSISNIPENMRSTFEK